MASAFRFSEKSASKNSDIIKRLSDTKRLSYKFDTPGTSSKNSERPFKVIIKEYNPPSTPMLGDEIVKSSDAGNFKRLESYVLNVSKKPKMLQENDDDDLSKSNSISKV